MRALVAVCALAACSLIATAGCSLIYDGSDLRGKASGRPKWTSMKNFVAGMSPSAVAVGDIDGDGKPDVVGTNQDDSTLTVLVNQGGGNFMPANTPRTCTTPLGLAMGDFNESGQSDAVVICYDDFSSTPPASAARSFLSTNGGFDISTAIPLAAEDPIAIASGDVDNDGHLDVVIAYRNPNGVAVHIGQGDGTFKAGPLVRLSDIPTDVAVTDLNGDGVADVAVASDASFQVLLSQSGALGSPTSHPLHNGGTGIAAGDFDGKNGRDLAIPTYTSFFLDVALNQGGGSFPASLAPELSFKDYPNRLRAADFDGDGHLDLVLGSLDSPAVMLFYGKGDGSFEDPIEIMTSSSTGLEVADLDGDGKPDIILSSIDQTGLVTILFNR